MSHLHDDPEEIAALAVLDGFGRLDSPDETSVPEPGDQVEEVLRRLFSEATGLLPYALELTAPPAALRGRLLTSVVGDSTQEVSDLVPADAVVEESTVTAPPAPPPPPRPPLEMRHSSQAASQVRRRRWPARFAAAAAIAALAGLGLWIAYLQSELRSNRVRLASAEREWKADAELHRAALARLERSFQSVTAAAVTIFPLRCPTGRGPAANARVYVYLPPDRSQWELAVHGLAAEPPGREYQVWFLVGDRPKSAGCFHLEDGRAVVAMPEKPPAGITGVAVTIEPKGGSPRPTGEMILLAQQPVHL